MNRRPTLPVAACWLSVALVTVHAGCQSFHRNTLPRRHTERARAEQTAVVPPAPAPVEVPVAPAPTKTAEAAPMHTTAPQPLPTESADVGPAKVRSLYQQAAERYAGLPAYTAQLRRREQVNGKDKPEEVMLFKFRQEPWSVYFKWVGTQSPGREAVFVKGQHNGQIHTLLAQGDMPLMPAGKVLSLPPDNHFVRASSRHSITDAGIGKMIEHFGQLVAGGGALRYVGPTQRREFPQPLEVVEETIPPGSEAPLPRGGKRQWFFHPESRLPVLVVTHDAAGHEVEFYCYERVQGPVALTDDDFNPEKLWKK